MPRTPKKISPREQALACLARREHSRAELARKLEQSGHPAEEIAPLLDDFEARNWLSDRRFAESYIADHRAKSGAIKLAYELRQRGVNDNIIEAVLSEHRDSEVERAHEVWKKKFKSAPADAQEKAKQMRFLQGRGFSMETIKRTLEGQYPGD